MKFLCLCQYGHSRSVAMARYLEGRGHEAVAVGVGVAPSAVNWVAQWADKIVLMQYGFISAVEPGYRYKAVICDVGPDRWSNPYHPELIALIEQLAPSAVGV